MNIKVVRKARTLLLVRHAQTEWNSEGRFQGHLDSRVTEEGMAQIAAVAQRLAHEDIDAVFTSDLGRSILTADRIARAAGAPVKVDERLRERSHGVFEGMTAATALAKHPEWVERTRLNRDPDFAVPMAESKQQILGRTLPAVVDAMEGPGDGSIVIVGHGGIINTFLNYASSQSLMVRNVVRNCSVSTLQYSSGMWRTISVGDAAHLA